MATTATTAPAPAARDLIHAAAVLGVPSHPAFTSHPEIARLMGEITAVQAARRRWFLGVEQHSREAEGLLSDWSQAARTAALAGRDIPPRPTPPDPPPAPMDFDGESFSLRFRAEESPPSPCHRPGRCGVIVLCRTRAEDHRP